MKTKLLIGLFCGAALSMQAQVVTTLFGTSYFGEVPVLNQYVFGVFITPTQSATVGQLDQDPWWGSSTMAEQWAEGYSQALFNWAKYQAPSLADRGLPLVYFAYAADPNGGVDTWTFDLGLNKSYNEFGNSLGLLIGMDPGAQGHGGYPVYSTPDTVSTAGLMVLALGGLVVFKKKDGVNLLKTIGLALLMAVALWGYLRKPEPIIITRTIVQTEIRWMTNQPISQLNYDQR